MRTFILLSIVAFLVSAGLAGARPWANASADESTAGGDGVKNASAKSSLTTSASPSTSKATSSEKSERASSTTAGNSTTTTKAKPTHTIDVDALLASLTLEEKVGQVMLLGFGGTTMDDTIARFLDEKHPGGVALFARNIKSVAQTTALIRAVRAHDPKGIPMFVSVDQEGGNVVRLKKDAIVLPSNMALGAIGDEDLAFRVGKALGHDLRLMGFNMNLAPVLDVNSNPKNPVIGIRSFGEDPVQVGNMGTAYMRGLQGEGIVAVAKHFPGHGDTEDDSHLAMPVLDHDRARLDAIDLVPFQHAIKDGLDALMTAHISLPKVAEENDMPATVSKNVLTGIARDALKFEGLIVTDGLEMNGIVDRYGSGEAAVRAVEAGADMVMVLWFPEKKDEVQRMLIAAVNNGRISPARLDESVRRILDVKARRGLFAPLVDEASAVHQLKDKRHRAVVDEVAARAITLVKNDGNALPLLVKGRDAPRVVIASTEPTFSSSLKRRLKKVDVISLSAVPSRSRLERDAARTIALGKDADVVVIGLMDGMNNALVKRVRAALPTTKIVVVSFGSPYLLSAFPDVDTYLCTFGFWRESEEAAARAVLGDKAPTGKLPVTISKTHPIGHQLSYAPPAAALTAP